MSSCLDYTDYEIYKLAHNISDQVNLYLCRSKPPIESELIFSRNVIHFDSSPYKEPIMNMYGLHQSPNICGDVVYDGSVNVSGLVFTKIDYTPIDHKEYFGENYTGGIEFFYAGKNCCLLAGSIDPCHCINN